MKTVSDKIKNSLKQPTTQRKGRILVNGEYYEIYNVEYNSDVYDNGNVIGNAIASQLDFDMPYTEKFDTFNYYEGVWTGTDYEYIDMGVFNVFDEKDEDEFNKHITAFDNLIKFNAPFKDLGDYPKTLFQELRNICTQAGVNLANTSIANGDFILENNQFISGESLKFVLKNICGISGNYAIIKNNSLHLQLKNTTDEKMYKNQHEPVEWKRKTYGINQVIIGMADVNGQYAIRQDDADIEKNGVHKLIINDNYFAYTQEKREQLIDALFNQVKGFGYVPYEMKCEWLTYMDVGDTITIDDVETMILRINGISPKALTSTMSAPSIIDSAVNYVDNTDTLENRVSRAEFSVDRANLKIDGIITDVDNIDLTLTTRKQASGFNNINIQDAGNYNVAEFGIDGNSYQETTKGINLASVNDSVENLMNFAIGDIESGKNYTLYLNVDGYISANLKNGLGGTTIKSFYHVSGKYVTTFTATENQILYFNGFASTQGNFNGIPQIMLLEGTYTLENIPLYEPYTNGASPNPDYPQEIKVVESNLFDKNKCVQGNYNALASNTNIRLTQFICPISIGDKYTFNVLNSNLRMAIGIGSVGTQISSNQLLFDSSWQTGTYTITANTSGYLFLTISKKDNTSITINDISQSDFEIGIGEEIGNIGIQIVGKNVLNIKDNLMSSHAGLNYTYNENGSLSIQGTSTSTWSYITNVINEELEIGTYVFSIDKPLNYRIYLSLNLEDGTTSSQIIETGNKSKVINLNKKCISYRVVLSALTNGNIYEETIFVMLEKGSTATECEAYQEQLTYIDLQDNFIGKIGDIKDKLYIKDGHAYLGKNIGKVVLDGSESWLIDKLVSGKTMYSFYTNIIRDIVKPDSNCMSSHFIYNPNVYYNDEIGIYVNWGGSIRIQPIEDIDTVEKLTTWLSNNNVEVYYVLETPETIDLGEVSFKTFEGVNNISLLASMETDINTIYLTDSPLNGEYTSRSEFIIETDKITSEVGKKVNIDVFEELDGTTNQLQTTVNNNYQEVINKFGNYTPTSQTIQLEQSVKQIQTDTYTKTEINSKLTDGSVTKVHTVSGTFDEDGMHYEKTNAPTSATINEIGVEVDSTISGEELLFAGYDEELQQTIVRTENLKVRRYLVVGDNTRIETYEGGGGIFIL